MYNLWGNKLTAFYSIHRWRLIGMENPIEEIQLSSYLQNGISFTGQTASLYKIGPHCLEHEVCHISEIMIFDVTNNMFRFLFLKFNTCALYYAAYILSMRCRIPNITFLFLNDTCQNAIFKWVAVNWPIQKELKGCLIKKKQLPSSHCIYICFHYKDNTTVLSVLWLKSHNWKDVFYIRKGPSLTVLIKISVCISY